MLLSAQLQLPVTSLDSVLHVVSASSELFLHLVNCQ